jgi:hypothetical protein
VQDQVGPRVARATPAPNPLSPVESSGTWSVWLVGCRGLCTGHTIRCAALRAPIHASRTKATCPAATPARHTCPASASNASSARLSSSTRCSTSASQRYDASPASGGADAAVPYKLPCRGRAVLRQQRAPHSPRPLPTCQDLSSLHSDYCRRCCLSPPHSSLPGRRAAARPAFAAPAACGRAASQPSHSHSVAAPPPPQEKAGVMADDMYVACMAGKPNPWAPGSAQGDQLATDTYK